MKYTNKVTSPAMGIFIGIAVGFAATVLAANIYSVWQPGGDLDPSSTWNSQTIATGAINLGGSKVTGQLPLGSAVSGALPEANGGTNQTTYTQGDLLYASAANTLSKLAKNTSSTRVLTNTGASNSPAWAQVALTTGVSGILPVANGGTNNAFIAWSGPASSTKTYTLPNASSTILTGFSGTTSSIGGGALLAGACTSGTVTVTGATTSMVAVASPNTYPGDGALWNAQVTSSNTVTVRVCADVALTPTASTYNVRVIQ